MSSPESPGSVPERTKSFWLMVFLGWALVVVFGWCTETSFFHSCTLWLKSHDCLVCDQVVSAQECSINRWRSWEIAAVIWFLFSAIYFWWTFPSPSDLESITTQDFHWITKRVYPVLFFGVLAPNIAALVFLLKFSLSESHVVMAFIAAIGFGIVNLLLWHKSDKKGGKRRFLLTFLIADLQFILGFLLILSNFATNNRSHLESEISTGTAIALQLVAANLLFLLIEGEFLPSSTVGAGHSRAISQFAGNVSNPAGSRGSSAVPRAEARATPTPSNGRSFTKGWVNLANTALSFGILGAIIVGYRLLSGSCDQWFRVGVLAIGTIAFLTGIGGFYVARRQSRLGTSFVLSVAGFCLGVLTLASGLIPLAVSDISCIRQLKPLLEVEPIKFGTFTALALSADGSLVARSSDHSIQVLSTRDGKLRWQKPVESGVLTLAFSPDGRELASAGGGPKVSLWNSKTGETLTTLGAEEENDEAAYKILCLEFSTSKYNLLATGAQSGEVKVWDLESGVARSLPPGSAGVVGHEGGVRALAFSADGNWLLSGGVNIILWHNETIEDRGLWRPKSLFIPSDNAEDDPVAVSVAISRDGNFLAAGTDDRKVLLWDRSHDEVNSDPTITVTEHKASVLALRFSKDETLLASFSENPGLILMETRTGKSKPPVETSSNTSVAAISFSRASCTLASANSRGSLNVWSGQQ